MLCSAAGGFVLRAGGEDYALAGPAWQEFRLTLQPGERTEIAGPFWNYETVWDLPKTNQPPAADLLSPPIGLVPLPEKVVTFGFAPLFSWERYHDVDATSLHILYPAITYARYGTEYRFHIGQLLSWAGGQEPDGANTKRTTLFPVYFRQRSTDPALNYTALFPIYGHLQGRLFRDEMHFVLWPLYIQTRKRDMITDNYLVPFVHVRHGPGLTGWQVWPLAGAEHQTPHTVTNRFGPQIAGGRDNHFLLWPVYFHNNLNTGTTNELHQRVVLPFYAGETSPARDARTYLWPLGVKRTDDRANRYRETAVAWPVAIFGRGETKRTDRVFPLYGRTRTPQKDASFLLWPVFRQEKHFSPVMDSRRTSFGMWLYTDSEVHDKTRNRIEWRHDCWPLFVHRHDLQGNERLQILAPLEPILVFKEGVRRSWAPFWSLWRAEKNAETGARSQSLLWNLYRRESAPGVKKCSLLFGLVQYHSTAAGARWRLFYLPAGKAKTAADRPAPGGG